ncbi:M4 family metallopeptidase [Nocardioides gilvus]|uniref:M4 family metallopeptidase n=1 Tax=Nocardioides gilvus TaxID=1735589 RepID=UPI000D74D2F8|nr:M4 family metallopeptidase [Nocardioides gilvus]
MRPRLTRSATAAGLVLALAASTASAVTGPATASPPGDGFGAAEVQESVETGAVSFVGTKPGRPLAPARGISARSTPRAAATAFLGEHAEEFGLGDGSTLAEARSHRQETGNTTVRVAQEIDGIEVLGGELAVQLDDRNRIVSAAGEVLPEGTAQAARPRITGERAARNARASVARSLEVKPAQVTVKDEGLRIFDSRILGGDVIPGAHTVYAIQASFGEEVRRQVFVEATTGAILTSIDEIHSARVRRVCDGANTADRHTECTAPNAVLSEGGNVAAQNAEVRQAYRYSGATYDWYKANFNRDSIDGRGMPLVSTVRYCRSGERCPFRNAFWDGRQMTYGQGFAVADDVVAHELTHGIIERTAKLFYHYQSGAINESIADVFGELIDQATTESHESPADRWRIGEDLPTKLFPRGGLRDMRTPSIFGDPARMKDGRYYKGASDNGGVHYNSGVNNKAAFLMTDGGSFNGQTVTGLGATKVAAIYYETLTGLLTSASDYQDLARALRQACKNVTGTKGITTTDCVSVDRAVRATEMGQARKNAVDKKSCVSGKKARWAFHDNVEGKKKWRAQRPWYVPGNPNRLKFDATYATSGTKNLWGFNRPGNLFPDRAYGGRAKSYSITTKKPITVPRSKTAFLRFRHAYMFDTHGSAKYDGGRVEYKVKPKGKKGTWKDLMAGKYPTKVNRKGSAFAGKKAFAGNSGGYGTTVKKFPKKLRGKKVFIRFRIATDARPDVYSLGWFIDDIGVGRCK